MAEGGEECEYKEDGHCKKCCEEMVELWRESRYCDVNLNVKDMSGDETVSAHKVVLAASIPYFKAMFACDMQEAKEKTVTLHGMSPAAVRSLVEFAYTGRVLVTPETAQDLLMTANVFTLPGVVQFCSRYLATHVTAENCLGIREFARQQDNDSLKQVANDFAMKNFTSVSKLEEFLGLSLEEVTEFVKSNDIKVDCEEDVYRAVTSWIREDLEDRARFAKDLYNFVRFPIMPEKYLDTEVTRNPLMQSQACQKFLKDAYQYHKDPGVVIFSNPKKTQPRSSVQGVICVVGGVDDSGDSLSDVMVYNPHNKQWKTGPKMMHHRSRLGVAMLNGELYAIGGFDLGSTLSSCEKYIPRENRWQQISSLLSPRKSCAVVVLQNRLFAIGGFSGSVFLKTVEIYNPDTDEWSPGPPMNEARSELTAVYLGQRIYAMGGCNSQGTLRSVEVFDVMNRRWSAVSQMAAPRTGFGECCSCWFICLRVAFTK